MKNNKITFLFISFFCLFFGSCVFFDPTPDHLSFSPNGEQIVVAGSTFKYDGNVFSKFNIKCKDIPVTFSCSQEAGFFVGSTFYAGDTPGIYIITVTGGNFSENTTVRILDKDYLGQPFEYNETVYQGRTTERKSSPIVLDTLNSGTITINEPSLKSFECDGFFRMKGIVDDPASSNYIMVSIRKKPYSEIPTRSLFSWSHYYLRDSFDTRIWLREGAGDYEITVFSLKNISNNYLIDNTEGPDGIIYKGDITGFSCIGRYSFTVTNTRDEDGRWLYPSGFVQSDNIELINAVTDITYNLNSTSEKIEKINSFVVGYLTYDNDSLVKNKRKAQDALSSYMYKRGVCEGYANLTAALLRICGIPAKVISGAYNSQDPINTLHSWNNVSFDGGQTFRFMEPQRINQFMDIPYDDSQNYMIYPKLSLGMIPTDEDGAYPRSVDDSEENVVLFTEPY